MLKKLFLSLIVLVIFAVIGATLYLNMIDWNQHKSVIAKQFSEATGKEVAFNGSVSFNLLPSPSIEAYDIDVYNNDVNNNQVTIAKIQRMVVSLSVQSLIHGRFNVEKMVMINPEFFIEQYADGHLNWQSPSSNNQDFTVKNVEVSLNSVMLQNAKVSYINKAYDIETQINDINGEVIAGSLSGPYKIEGSYLKNRVPVGFSINLGQFSESFATSVNAVISHEQSESFARFDGTVLLSNDAINGNVSIDSRNPINFLSSLFDGIKISEDYEYPLAMGLAVKTDKKQISLSDIVIKYAETEAAGNILIPRGENNKIVNTENPRKQIDVAFNMAKFNPKPVIDLLTDLWKKYDGKEYLPDVPFDVIADFKSLETKYNNQVIKDLDLSIDFVDNVLTIQNLTGALPFDGSFSVKGEVYEQEKALTYAFDIEATTPDFAKTVKWLGYDLQPLSKNVYKRSSTKFTLSGNQKTIKIDPFIFNLDKTGTNGKLALVRGDNNKYFTVLEVDHINFDNYIADMPQDIADKYLQDQINYRFNQLSALKNLDLQFRINLGNGVWGHIPFQKLATEGFFKDGIMEITDLSIADFASAHWALRGEVTGFGGTPQAKNLKYAISTNDTVSFTKKMGIDLPNVNFGNLSQLNSHGTIAGTPDHIAIKSTSKLGHIESSYAGQIQRINGVYSFNGNLNVNSDNFVKTLNDFSINYRPDYPLGLLKLSANIGGSPDNFVLKDMNANVGSNNFVGEVSYSSQGEQKLIKATLNINKFELERFFYNKTDNSDAITFRIGAESSPFFSKPILSKDKINYDWTQNLELEAKIHTDELSFKNILLKDASWLTSLSKQVLKISQFTSQKNEGTITADLLLDIPNQNDLTGKIDIRNMVLPKDQLAGLVYGVRDGIFETDIQFKTSASSAHDMFHLFSGTGSFAINDPTVKGWNFDAIEKDLESREKDLGLKGMIQQNLSRGETKFNTISGTFVFDNGAYKFDNIVLTAKPFSVNVRADGSVDQWTLNASCVPSFTELKDIPSFDFTFSGPLNAPSLETNVNALSDMYTAKQEKLAAEAKAANEARIAKYRTLMDEQQATAQKSFDQLQNDVIPSFREYSAKAEDKDIKDAYVQISQQITKTNSTLHEIMSKNRMIEISDEVISKLQQQNDDVKEQLKKIDRDIKDTYSRDAQARVSHYYNLLLENSVNIPEYSSLIIDINGSYGKRLAEISTNYNIAQDQTLAEMQEKIETLVLQINTINEQTAQKSISPRTITSNEVAELYAQQFKENYQSVKSKEQEAQSLLESYRNYLEEKVSSEEKIFKDKVAQSEAASQRIQTSSPVKHNVSATSSGGSPLIIKLEDGQKVESGGRILK